MHGYGTPERLDRFLSTVLNQGQLTDAATTNTAVLGLSDLLITGQPRSKDFHSISRPHNSMML